MIGELLIVENVVMAFLFVFLSFVAYMEPVQLAIFNKRFSKPPEKVEMIDTTIEVSDSEKSKIYASYLNSKQLKTHRRIWLWLYLFSIPAFSSVFTTIYLVTQGDGGLLGLFMGLFSGFACMHVLAKRKFEEKQTIAALFGARISKR